MKSLLLKLICAALPLALLGGCGAPQKSEKQTKTQTEEATVEDIVMEEKNETSKVQVGEIVTFGTFDLDGKSETEKEGIPWLVLSTDGAKALLISVKGLDSRLYNDEAIEVEWANSSLRAWLNGTFMKEAFTAEEAERITLCYSVWEDNPVYPAGSGKSVEDHLFLLSISDVESFFGGEESRTCVPSGLAVTHGVYADEETGTCAWWLRNSGSAPEMASYVDVNGAINPVGDGVYCEGFAVRPAMWVDFS